MRKLEMFNQVSLDGYFCGADGDLSWAHEVPQDEEWNDFVSGNAGGDGVLLFGRVTYEMMASFWPTPEAAESAPDVAEGMNRMEKVVFSRTLNESSWSNTRLVKDDPAAEVRRLKSESGPGMTILGSGTIVAQLARENLIDEYQLVVVPVILGEGRTLFSDGLRVKRTKVRAFGNGNVLLCYEAQR